MTSTFSSATKQIARAAGTVMFAMALSMLIGLVRRVMMANDFGTGLEVEAFAAANRVSETIFNLVAGGALASAFIPTYTTLLSKDDNDGAWKLASSIGNLVLIVVAIMAIIAAVFAPQIVRYLLVPGFSSDPYKEQLTISLLRLMLPSAVIFALSGLFMGILNSHQKFLIPALAPSMYSIGMIFGIVFLVPSMGIYGLAWGVLIGASLHLLLQVPSLIRLGGQYFATLGLRYPPVIETLRLMGPRLVGVAVVQLNFWINVWLASYMIEGSVNGLILAFAIMLMPQSIIAQSIAIAAMPTFSAQAAKGQLNEMRNSLVSSLRGLLILTIPATIGLVILREELVVIIYQRGEFTEKSTELVAWALLWYGLGLVAHSVVELLSRAFYSIHDTKTPVTVGIIAMSLNVFFSLLFVNIFKEIGWLQLGGLALANTLATTIEMVALTVIMRQRLNSINLKSLIKITFQSLLAAVVMLISIVLWLSISHDKNVWFAVCVAMIIGGIVYWVVLYLIGIPEIREVPFRIRKIFVNAAKK